MMKDLKKSTKQHFMSLVFNHTDLYTETRIITLETGLSEVTARQLASLDQKIRNLHELGLAEGVSSRLLTYAARMIKSGMQPVKACRVDIAQSLTDDSQMIASLLDVTQLFFLPMQPSIPDFLEKVLGGISPGYRGSFSKAVHQLSLGGMIGTDNHPATCVLFNLLDQATGDRRLEHLLRNLFQSLIPENRWLFRYPELLQS